MLSKSHDGWLMVKNVHTNHMTAIIAGRPMHRLSVYPGKNHVGELAFLLSLSWGQQQVLAQLLDADQGVAADWIEEHGGERSWTCDLKVSRPGG